MIHINFKEIIPQSLDDIGNKILSHSKLWLIWFELIKEIVACEDFEKILTQISIWEIDVNII